MGYGGPDGVDRLLDHLHPSEVEEPIAPNTSCEVKIDFDDGVFRKGTIWIGKVHEAWGWNYSDLMDEEYEDVNEFIAALNAVWKGEYDTETSDGEVEQDSREEAE
jgi:hypothetical protein